MGDYSPVEAKIIKQIEYYFGDINLQRDKFLLDQIKLDEGWVSLDILLTFNRLSQITTDKEVIANALNKVVDALVEVHEDRTKIRRSPDKPLGTITKEYLDERRKKTIYAKGLPLQATLDLLLEFFEKFGSTEQVTMRKNFEKKFKGSCFVVYKNEVDAKTFLDSTESFLPDQPLEKIYQQDYFKKKSEERKKNNLNKKLEAAKALTESIENSIVKGSVMDISGFAEGSNIKEIKEFFNKFSKVEWVDLENQKARIRFSEEGIALKVIDLVKADSTDGKIIFNSKELECRILEGEEEKEHWSNLMKDRKLRLSQKGKISKHQNTKGQKRGKNRDQRGPNKKFKKNKDGETGNGKED